MSNRETGKRFALSLAAGLLLIPLSATAGFAIINGIATDPIEPAKTLSADSATTTTAPTEVVVQPVAATPYDLILACGPDGMSLVAAENDGTISDVQQAALDALRQICAEAGMPLPNPVAPVVVESAVQQLPSPTATAQQPGHDDDRQSGEHEGEHEDDHETEYEHEDD
jgi:hypothetical protein